MRVLVSYLVLLTFCAVVSAVVTHEVLEARLEGQVEDQLQQEVLELDRLLAEARDPGQGRSFDSLEEMFSVFFGANVPGTGEAVLAYVEGEPVLTDLRSYPLREIPAPGAQQWGVLVDDPVPGTILDGSYATPLGEAQYLAEAVSLAGERGTFVVTILPAPELSEIAKVRSHGLVTSAAVILFASAMAWLFAGRVLEPVRELTLTARSISESDLTRRVEVSSEGEAGEMARSFNAMLDRIELVLASQQEFVRRAGHELRDPLTICRGHLELLRDGIGDAESTLPLVLDELSRMGRIVGDLQTLADADQLDFVRLEDVDLATFTHELLVKAATLGERTWVLDAAAVGTVRADRHRLTEAVMNLVHNAVMHTQDGATVAVGTTVTGDRWRLWVRDTGVGMPSDPRVFEPHHRGDGARARYQGAGLGLAIVRLVAQAHQGQVTAVGVPGLGTTVTLDLPRVPEGRAGG